MRNHVLPKLSISLVVGVVLLTAVGLSSQAKRDEPVAKSTPVSGSGCVTAGVEAGCLMVTDSKTGAVYNVFFRGSKKPKVGTAIRFSGTPHDGPTTCMQGQAVNVTTWLQLKMKCKPAN
jgi:hypothetical protein